MFSRQKKLAWTLKHRSVSGAQDMGLGADNKREFWRGCQRMKCGRLEGFQMWELMCSGFSKVPQQPCGRCFGDKGQVCSPFLPWSHTPGSGPFSYLLSYNTSFLFCLLLVQLPLLPPALAPARVIFLEPQIFSCYYVPGNLLILHQPQGENLHCVA